MTHPDLAVVTGAFSYTGNYVARRLLKQGVRVRTLTRSPDQPNPFGGAVEAAPLDFSDSEGLRRSMEGADVFYNTYWMRFARGRITFDRAVENTNTLFMADKRAGVGRIVHFSRLWTNFNCHGAAASDPWGRPEGWASDMGNSW